MERTDKLTAPAGRLAVIVSLACLAIAGCGLGIDTAERLDRSQKAFDDGEYRAAIIDAKNVLQDEPQNVEARLLLGRVSLLVGDGGTAEKELRRAVELGIDPSEVVVDLGHALLLQQQFDRIIDEVTPDLAKAPRDRLQVLQIRGDALLGMGEPAAAREMYSAILREDEKNVAVQVGIVESYLDENNLAQARATLNYVLELESTYVPAWLASGSIAMAMYDVERAASDFETAKRLSAADGYTGGELQASFGLAEALFAQDKKDDVRPLVERMAMLAPSDERTLLVAAKLAAGDLNWARAQQHLQEILRGSPDFRPAQLMLGAVHKESGNIGQAEMFLSAVVAAEPSNNYARRLLAETRLALNKSAEALETLRPVVAGSAQDNRTLSMAAHANLKLGEYDVAEALLHRGITADPQNADLQIQLAFSYLAAGKSDEAQRILQALPAIQSEQSKFRRDGLQVLTLISQGDTQEALSRAESLRSRWPDRTSGHVLVGIAQMALGDYPQARQTFNIASERDPADIGIIRYLAQLDQLDNDPKAAQDRYLLILELEPKDIQSMLELARLAARRENSDESRRWLEQARETDAAAVAPRAILGSIYLASKDYSAAEKVLKEAIAIDKDSARLHNLLGLAELNLKHYRAAVSDFGNAMRLEPADPSYRLNLARAQAHNGNMASALAILQESNGQSLEHIPTGVMLATLQAELGNLAEAKKLARKLSELHPDAALPHELEAELFVKSGDPARASAAFDQALAKDTAPRYAVRAFQVRSQAGLEEPVASLVRYLNERPLDDEIRMYLAQAYQAGQELDKAIREYEYILNHDPENVVAANNLAWSYFRSGDGRAEAMARRAYEIQPDSGAVVDTLGWILLQKGAVREGVSMLRRAVELEDGRPEIRFHLAVGLIASGETREAKSMLEEILATDNKFASRSQAQELLSTL